MPRGWRSRRRSYGYYSRSPRREVEEGGIRARSKRGKFTQKWWGNQWIDAIERILDSGRLSRGRTYARSGQVRTLDIGPGRITAQVQGSRPTPYEAIISLDVLTDEDWRQVAEAFREDASQVAALLAGNLPKTAGEIFRRIGTPLLPEKQEDLRMECSCPDWSNPCKHLAALFYLLGEEIDNDPFMLFRLRGRTREEFLLLLNADADTPALPAQGEEEPPEELPTGPAQFWKPFREEALPSLGFRPPALPATLPRRLGPLPFWQGTDPFLETMESLYTQGSRQALSLLEQDRGDGDSTVTPECSSEPS